LTGFDAFTQNTLLNCRTTAGCSYMPDYKIIFTFVRELELNIIGS
jgi:hypothetical protein